MKKIILFVLLLAAFWQINSAKAALHQSYNLSLLTDTLIGADTIYYIQYKPDEIAALIAIWNTNQEKLLGYKIITNLV